MPEPSPDFLEDARDARAAEILAKMVDGLEEHKKPADSIPIEVALDAAQAANPSPEPLADGEQYRILDVSIKDGKAHYAIWLREPVQYIAISQTVSVAS